MPGLRPIDLQNLATVQKTVALLFLKRQAADIWIVKVCYQG